MLFDITGKHIEITEAIREHAVEKTSKLPKFYNSINKISVIIEGSEGKTHSVEIIASSEHNNVFIAKEAGDDVYSCIDTTVHKLERQLKKKKEIERDNKHIGGRQTGETA